MSLRLGIYFEKEHHAQGAGEHDAQLLLHGYPEMVGEVAKAGIGVSIGVAMYDIFTRERS